MPGSFLMNNENFSGGFPIQGDRQIFLQAQNRRKFSFPATLHSTSLFETNQNSTRRRLSNVSDVTRKLSYTIGWKVAQTPAEEIVTQGKYLCGHYIKRRLRRSGMFNKKLGTQRIRRIFGTTSVGIVREVFPAIMVLGDELERMHPRVYSGVARQMSRIPGGEFQSPETITLLLGAVARDLFRNDITWSKIISLFAIAGGLSVDCVRQGHPEYLPKLVQGVSDVIEDELVSWINENGGWNGINIHVHPTTSCLNPLEWTTLIIGVTFGVFILFILIRFIVIYIVPLLYPYATTVRNG